MSLRDIISWYGTSGPVPSQRTLESTQAPIGVSGSPAEVYDLRQQLAGLKPSELIRLLREADSGDLTRYLQAVSELEERDPQYGAVMSTRRTAIRALEYELTRPSGTPARPYKAAKKWIASGALSPAIDFLLDGFGPGFAATELVWEYNESTRLLEPVFEERDPRQFRFDETGRNLLLDNGFEGEELEPYKWACHFPRCRGGATFRSGLGRTALYYNMLKTLALSGMVKLQTIYGVPQAVVYYDKRLSAEEVVAMRQALELVGTGVGVALPNTTNVEFKQAGGGGQTTSALYMDALDYIDAQISKLVLGQTMTTDSGGSHAQATVHNEVRGDIREADAERLADTLTEVVSYFIDVNFGKQRTYPQIKYIMPETMLPEQVVATASGLVALGLPVDTDELYARAGFTKPADAPDVIGSTPSPTPNEPATA